VVVLAANHGHRGHGAVDGIETAMSGHRLLPLVATVSLCAATAVGCTGESGTPVSSPPTSPTTTSPSPPHLAADVPYATTPDGFLPATLDVYSPETADGAPVVVILHGGGDDKSTDPYPQLAAALVKKGVVVVTANHGPENPDLSMTEDDPVGIITTTVDEIGCAITAAAAKAAELGADSSRLVVVGHSAGANLSAMAALRPRTPLPGCSVTDPKPDVTGLLLWEGDWFGSSAGEVLGKDTADFVSAYSPWPTLGSIRTTVPIELVMADPENGTYLSLPATPTSRFMRLRDPSGDITRVLKQIGAFDDGELDVYESSEGFSRALTDHGIANTLVVLEDPATTHTELAGTDFPTFVDHVVGLTESSS
jgi:acetyl esterase/lipase